MAATIGERLALGMSAEKKILLAVDRLRQTNGKVLVVGCRGDNFPEPYREHPSMIFWEGDESVRSEIPAAVRVVLMTKFVGHSGYNRVHDECVRRNILFGTKLMGTGEIKTLLSPLMADNGSPSTESASTEPSTDRKEQVVSKPKRFARGEQQAFIAENWDHAAPNVAGEARRLTQIARTRGYATSTMSIMNGFYLARRKLTVAAQDVLKKAPVPVTVSYKAGTPVLERVPPIDITGAGVLADDDAALINMLDEATAKLADLSAVVGLIRDTVQQRGDARRQIKEMLRRL